MPRKEKIKKQKKELLEAAKGSGSLSSWFMKSTTDGQRVESNRSDEEMEIEEEKEGNVEAQVTEREQGKASQETKADEKVENVEAQATETVIISLIQHSICALSREKQLPLDTF
ncbi:hypothetical protein DPX16_16095 [Anabarilius grahami]|uniref:Uncharacterized protein n=1 Tax=Anabarilius grahami TaxID=495550 RepID=A0A3N0YNE2_ANAGA|nr:hypothetical protein DPX16_16095 [Anabarilius grahami]